MSEEGEGGRESFTCFFPCAASSSSSFCCCCSCCCCVSFSFFIFSLIFLERGMVEAVAALPFLGV